MKARIALTIRAFMYTISCIFLFPDASQVLVVRNGGGGACPWRARHEPHLGLRFQQLVRKREKCKKWCT